MGRHPLQSRSARLALVVALGAALTIPSCTPTARAGTLPPTLTVEDRDGSTVAMQNGIPVPTFDAQPGLRLTLDGPWRVERTSLDVGLSLAHRDDSLAAIEEEAAGRHSPGYDDAAFETVAVPGAVNPPPDGVETDAWYRRDFSVPSGWVGRAAILKFGAVNYLADVWINGTWVGYHEGGYTPFAFDISPHLVPGEVNTIAIRVANPAWGSRNDIVPWGLADWWNYGGITRSVWIEGLEPMHVTRADIVPHLDGFDAAVTVRHAEATIAPAPDPAMTPSGGPANAKRAGIPTPPPELRLELFPAEVTPGNVTQEGARALVGPGVEPLATETIELGDLDPAAILRREASFLLGGVDLWSPERPALYVVHAAIRIGEDEEPGIWTSFGLRDVSVEPESGRLLLNGQPTMFTGVALHDEVIEPAVSEEEVGGHRPIEADEILAQLERAAAVDADLIRAGHTPANPLLLMLADRLGFAVWEEIPLYHYTPLTFGLAMDRGVPQQMLREMALRDMNRPSVLFHGLANESTGTGERTATLAELHDLDRAIDGTRLTGQAAYGSDPGDPTHALLDVAGFTFYYGVFYGADAGPDTARALEAARQANPGKPVIALEFGRWADDTEGPERQREIFEETFPEFLSRRASAQDGFVGGAVWWTLLDYTTARPLIGVEHFGLFAGNGVARPAAEVATRQYAGAGGEATGVASDVRRARPLRPSSEAPAFLLHVAYAFAVSAVLLVGTLVLLLRTGGRSIGRRRA